MGQVPHRSQIAGTPALNSIPRILIVGGGRVASALSNACLAQSIQSDQWHRASSRSFEEIVFDFDPTHVWLAISDSALQAFTLRHSKLLQSRTNVHFAGSMGNFVTSEHGCETIVYAAHPLTTFSSGNSIIPSIENMAFEKIPFVLDSEGPDLSELLPGFHNPTARLDADSRSYYHALCTVAGNFTVLLWETVAQDFSEKLGLDPAILNVYREQIFKNLATASRSTPSQETPVSVLTGPFVRGDQTTIERHRNALRDAHETALLKIYDGFFDLYRTRHSAANRRLHENHP